MSLLKRCAWVVAVAVLAACGPGPTEPDAFEFGRLEVYVRDAAGQPVNGAAVRLHRLSGEIEDEGGLTGTVGLPGYYFFLRTGGEFRVTVTPPAGYAFAAGQESSVRVAFSRNQLQTVNFVVRRIDSP
jgi:hypothetical protein